MKSHAQAQMLPDRTLVLAAAADLSSAEAAVAAGAELVDLWGASQQAVAAIRARHPAVLACAAAGWACLVRDPSLARRTGAVLICADAGDAGRAEADGIGRGRLLVQAPPERAAGLLAAGWRVIVDADPAGPGPGPHAAAAVAAIACWLGAAAVRTRHVAAARRAIDMTEAIKTGKVRAARPASGGCARPG